jgi:pyrimidine operon attenuation protein/uracil phosphoribosyltransferase
MLASLRAVPRGAGDLATNKETEMKRSKGLSWKSLEAVCILLVLLTCGATPSRAYQQDLKKMATDLAARIHAMKHTHVTVVDFVDLDSKPTKLGKFLAQQLQANLAEPDLKLVVVDQSQLSLLMDQIEKLNEGLLDPATGRQLGQMAGTEVIVVGMVMPSSMTVRLDITAIDLQTAKVITAGSASVARLGLIERLAREASGEEDTETASANEGQKATEAKKPVPQAPARSRRDQGMIFDLDGCSLSADTVICEMTVTSIDRERWLAVTSQSRAWTEAGEEYGTGEITIANSKSASECTVKRILKNVPARVSVTFPGFGEEVGVVERLRVYWSEEDDCWSAVRNFRSIDFDKIEFSDETYASSPQKTSRPGKQLHGFESAGKKKGGILQRIGGRVLDAVEEAAADAIDKQTRKLVGDDEEEQQPPKKNR